MSSDIAIRADGIAKTYRLYSKPVDRLLQGIFPGVVRFREKHALQPISFTLHKGETLGIVGCNGSGKSTLLQLLCGILAPTSGTCKIYGKIAALLELGSGFNPEFTGKENIYLNATLLGLSREEIQARYQDIVHFSGLGEAINQAVKTYSSGMYVRLAFAVASAVDPDIFIIDEALAVGDERFQRKCYKRIKELKEKGTTILFVSHSAHSIVDICDRAILLDQGEMLLMGTPKHVIGQYHHLIYAPESKRAEVRKKLKAQLHIPVIEEEGGIEASELLPERLEFIPDMRAETLLSHASRGAEIHNFSLYKPDGTAVNLLTQRELYSVAFDVTFSQAFQGVRFQYIIQKPTGVIVHSSNTKQCDTVVASVKEGDTFRVAFKFQCFLLPGYYYITLNCAGLEQKELSSLHRITDAIMFNVVPNPAIQAGGIVDLMSEPTIQYMSELC